MPDCRHIPHANAPHLPDAIAHYQDAQRPGMAAKAIPSSGPAPGREVPHCLVLLNRAMSMRTEDWLPNRIEAAKEATLSYARRLSMTRSQTQLAIVIFSEEVHTLCGFHPAGDCQFFAQALARIRLHLGVRIADALDVAHRMMARVSGPRHVLLLTDTARDMRPWPLPAKGRLGTIAHVDCIAIGRQPPPRDHERYLRAVASTAPDGCPGYRWIGAQHQLVPYVEQTAGRLDRS